MKTVRAIYENGIFHPTENVELPEYCEVEFEPRIIGTPNDPSHHRRVQAMLGLCFNSGRNDIAVRHDEHQP